MSRTSERPNPAAGGEGEHGVPLKVLIVEDSEDDAVLIADALRSGGLESSCYRVETAEGMQRALEQESWQVILADHKLPQFSSTEAFQIYRHSGLDIPFIIVSGLISDDAAAVAMKQGVHDYVMKGKLGRLAPAVRRELAEAKIRRERARVEARLHAAYSELSAIYANCPVALLVVDEEFRVEKANEMAARFAGRKAFEMQGLRYGEALLCPEAAVDPRGCTYSPSCSECPVCRAVSDIVHNGTTRDNMESWVRLSIDSEKKERWLLVSCGGIDLGQRKRVLVCARDITELQLAHLDLERQRDAREAALAEKTVLLKEIHHRVKNNLAIIASLLSMKAATTDSDDARAALRQSQERVHSMALIHEHLYRSQNLDRVNFAEYARTLSEELYQVFISEPGRISVRLSIQPIELSIQRAVPCGLILNELIANAFKYAFPGGRRGEISISFREVEPGRLELAVEDDGVGLPAGLLQSPGASSLGLRIVNILTTQLDGTLEQQPSAGTRIVIRFAGK